MGSVDGTQPVGRTLARQESTPFDDRLAPAIFKGGSDVQRYGQVIGIKPEHIEEYERLHRAAWPEVLAMIHECNIRNYSIYRYDNLLFAYFEYVGDNFEADSAKMAADPKTQEWWSICKPMQEPVPEAGPEEWWKTVPEVFHTD